MQPVCDTNARLKKVNGNCEYNSFVLKSRGSSFSIKSESHKAWALTEPWKNRRAEDIWYQRDLGDPLWTDAICFNWDNHQEIVLQVKIRACIWLAAETSARRLLTAAFTEASRIQRGHSLRVWLASAKAAGLCEGGWPLWRRLASVHAIGLCARDWPLWMRLASLDTTGLSGYDWPLWIRLTSLETTGCWPKTGTAACACGTSLAVAVQAEQRLSRSWAGRNFIYEAWIWR